MKRNEQTKKIYTRKWKHISALQCHFGQNLFFPGRKKLLKNNLFQMSFNLGSLTQPSEPFFLRHSLCINFCTNLKKTLDDKEVRLLKIIRTAFNCSIHFLVSKIVNKPYVFCGLLFSV